MKLVKSIGCVLFLLALVAGCSQETKVTKEEVKLGEKDQEDTNKNKENESENKKQEEEKTEAYEPEETFEEIAFQNVDWFFGSPKLQPKGGIWVYNAEKHPGEIEETFEWETEDVLLVQINDPNYKNHKLTIKGLQNVDNETVKIVASFKALENDEGKTPRRYITIEKSSLDGKKFVIEDEKTGEAVKLN
ncbi:hypothetical protein KHA94_05285 [Bacillus sp. FJAT-49705]|uniref:Lipoprotein n=1 Tax=Cytobacillus citreus TaxID=2833586 RepID=A0ABS5NP65_9BACI|nr:hypothetical protein [Cytobacillus citreus]MBS4189624.1 hypothetical protein [Cytobacillus citreus]